ncbi:excinuclease ABC subunit UvrC [Megamonas hypermegale]|jgi:excinuclease ABC subunit C|uniref:excinuclease ABC subunit UvrC n=1 Tax=Megamonas hypermegale TaxID=158847 RepID=UPI00195A57C3|nr:excinuclease ABC subunit UvrC [Megamonas hypermegale]MBM6760810.1 excinuclease ABC subunit UvrC [Megamonas hypermegale]
MNDVVAEKLKLLPEKPGVYLMKNKRGQIIYVGKAIKLKNRVRQYFQSSRNHSAKTIAMVSHIEDFETIITDNELEALILECNLIKKHHPKYNIMLRDDKTYPYLKITLNEQYPRLTTTRRVIKDGSKYFGPYTNITAMKETVKLLRRLFPLRTCKHLGERPCLEYHIKRCLAPCARLVKEDVYNEMVQSVCLFLEGKTEDIEKNLTAKMQNLAQNLEFEMAGKIRDQLLSIRQVTEKQKILTDTGNMDAIGMATSPYGICMQVFFVRSGKILGRNQFLMTGDMEDNKENALSAFLKQYYNDAVFIPAEILLPQDIKETALLEKWLAEEKSVKTKIITPKRGVKKDIVEMANENAVKYLQDQENKLKDKMARSIGAVYDLQKYLHLTKPPMRMECFDISHIQGSETVASMVVFQDGKPDKESYRRFKINSTEGKPDDFMSMREVTMRRYGKATAKEMPDLIIIDGGKGQLSSALEIIRGAGHLTVPVVGLAKQFEYIFTEHSSEPVILPRQSDALYLVQQIRDEAHRFAITYHRNLRTKRNKVSLLDNIAGIGAKRRKALFDRFENIANIKNATVEELSSVPGISENIAKSIYNFFRTHELISKKI